MRGAALALAIMAIIGAAMSILAASRRSSDAEHMRADLIGDVDRGGFSDLGRAQALGRRLVVRDPHDRDATAALAFASAMLAVDYGFDTARETEAMLARFDGSPTVTDGAASMAEAAHALVALYGGDRNGAAHTAAGAATAAPGSPYPLFALGRARARAGDLVGASRAFEAAIVDAPNFVPARVAWAEVSLDLGRAKPARAALDAVVARAPRDLRAELLLEEAEQALGVGGNKTLRAACPDGKWPPPVIQAGCALALGVRARRSGARAEARSKAEAAGALAPREPRLLARIAELLAQIGAVDRAATLTERARRLAASDMPALAWANLAVALGRGRAGTVPSGPRPADLETALLSARAALAAGGVGALVATLDGLGAPALGLDWDLTLLARLRAEAAPADTVAANDPVRAYVDGLRAHLDGNLPVAAARLRHAMSGHGDACRAAGEYVATLRAQKHPPDPTAWPPLKSENTTCINLP